MHQASSTSHTHTDAVRYDAEMTICAQRHPLTCCILDVLTETPKQTSRQTTGHLLTVCAVCQQGQTTHKLQNALCSMLPLFETPCLRNFHDVAQRHPLTAGILQHLQGNSFVGAWSESFLLFLHVDQQMSS